MSRIDEIKESLLTAKGLAETTGYNPDSHEFIESVEYLLDKLEQAEKSLERLSTGQFSAPMEYSQVEAHQKYAESILQQLRKD